MQGALRQSLILTAGSARIFILDRPMTAPEARHGPPEAEIEETHPARFASSRVPKSQRS